MGRKTLVIGTCRVEEPSRCLNNIMIFGAGTTQSLGQCLQAVRVLYKDIKIPHNVYKQVFIRRVNRKKLENRVINFDEIDKIVLEVASIHNRYINVDGNRIYVWKDICPSCLTETDNTESMTQKLHFFCSFFPNKEILLVPFPIRYDRGDRQILAKTLENFANKNNYDYFDPLLIIKEHGDLERLKRNDYENLRCIKKSKIGNYDHYTRFMVGEVRNRISMFINKNEK